MSFDLIANSRLVTRGLKLLGLWPAHNDDTSYFGRYYRYYQFSVHTVTTFLITLLMFLEVVYSENFEYATQVLKFLLTEIGLVLKIFNIWYYAQSAANFLHEWETSKLFALETIGERAMWQRHQGSYKKLAVFYVGGSVNAAILALIAIQFMSNGELPFPYWIPKKWREDYYWLMYAFELVAMPFTVFCNIQIDVFQCYLLLHLTLCVQVIGMRLERLGTWKEGHDGDGGGDQATTKQFLKIIRMHRRVIDMSKICERIVSLPLLVQIMLSSLIICFIIYRLQSVRFSDNPAEFSAMLQYVIVMSLQIFLPCYYANELTVQSQKLSYHLYTCNWIKMSVKNRRLIFLYMEYLKRPIILHAGNFFELGLPIFSKTMNNAYSLLALLLNVNGDRK